MRAEIATKIATSNKGFTINFDKKALREQALSASTGFETLRHAMMKPLMLHQLQPLWRAKLVEACDSLVRKDNKPSTLSHMSALLSCVESYAEITDTKRPLISIELLNHMADILGEKPCDTEQLHAWIEWVNGAECMKLAPEYRAVLAIFYLQMVHPFGAHQVCVNMGLLTYLLRCAGFEDVAEGVAHYFCADEYRLTKIFIATQKSQHLKYFQTQWIMHYLAVLQQFLSETIILMQKKYDQALFDQARHGADINERQAAIIDQLILNHSMRDKKSLFHSSFYRALYIKQSRRTQERDFKALCDTKLIIMKDTLAFMLAIDLG